MQHYPLVQNCIPCHAIPFRAYSKIAGLIVLLSLQLGAHGEILNDGLFRTHSCAEYIARSSKVVTLVDLAGHERYFKTTAYGLTGHLPDYACLIVGANAGVLICLTAL